MGQLELYSHDRKIINWGSLAVIKNYDHLPTKCSNLHKKRDIIWLFFTSRTNRQYSYRLKQNPVKKIHSESRKLEL